MDTYKITDIFSIHILRAGDIKTSANGAEYRHIVFEDYNNLKMLDYIIFKKKHQSIWNNVSKTIDTDIVYPGKIINFEITHDFLKYIRSGLPLTVKSGDNIDIVVWYWSNWDHLPDRIRIIRSFEDQIWRFRSFPKANR